ncbi:MAG: hypothetical protein CME70_19435 [Halobacteriovorax sp.]|nr:hypothetical protein [Halobacteriovorax sp.]MBK26180.1 hypothetical protein [Halobacteriovorax sp.]|tara:strand:+ start:1540 stop:1743 length:204 start_codon:yes stop_codon:yes gene_type:complete
MKGDVSKVITWRVISLIVGTIITYAYLGEIRQSIELTVIFSIVMTVLHYFFEKWWKNKVNDNQLTKS